MRGGRARGLLIGAALGMLVTGALILLPAALQGDFYEIGDALLVMGVPIIVLSAIVGAVVVASPRGSGAGRAAHTSKGARQVWIGCLCVGALLAVWLLLWGTGAISTPVLWIG